MISLDSFRLAGETAAVTDGAYGIGRAITDLAAVAGADFAADIAIIDISEADCATSAAVIAAVTRRTETF